MTAAILVRNEKMKMNSPANYGKGDTAVREVRAISIIRTAVIVLMIALSGVAAYLVTAQQAGTRRTDLQKHDISITGHEAVQVRVDFDPGAVAPKHKHPGEEIVYVLE